MLLWVQFGGEVLVPPSLPAFMIELGFLRWSAGLQNRSFRLQWTCTQLATRTAAHVMPSGEFPLREVGKSPVPPEPFVGTIISMLLLDGAKSSL